MNKCQRDIFENWILKSGAYSREHLFKKPRNREKIKLKNRVPTLFFELIHALFTGTLQRNAPFKSSRIPGSCKALIIYKFNLLC